MKEARARFAAGEISTETLREVEDREIADELLAKGMHFSEMSANKINQTELVALLINMGNDFTEGINNVYAKIDGSCSMLILTEDGIIAARDYMGRTTLVVGRKEGAYAATSETTAFPNLDYETVRDVEPGEIVRLRADGMEVMQKPSGHCQICSFLWVFRICCMISIMICRNLSVPVSFGKNTSAVILAIHLVLF